MTAARIVFAGTPEFAVPSLRALAGADLEIASVLTQPDRPAGRGRAVTASPVKREALARGLEVRQPASLRDRALLETLDPVPDLIVVVAYGLLLPQWLLDWPARGCVNVHASLLPRWRGADSARDTRRRPPHGREHHADRARARRGSSLRAALRADRAA